MVIVSTMESLAMSKCLMMALFIGRLPVCPDFINFRLSVLDIRGLPGPAYISTFGQPFSGENNYGNLL
ncbi:hypothetical protein CEXT_355951 [Caerostris extrusa]|uniref:Uncharacterized protein n=1 Tax=Caerostris extrusa TaxID=172846 RepID=A0AAV4QZQ5_CAEEX|nr:hypothetical protein CEXT_355951 [Caerostris extrusa]